MWARELRNLTEPAVSATPHGPKNRSVQMKITDIKSHVLRYELPEELGYSSVRVSVNYFIASP